MKGCRAAACVAVVVALSACGTTVHDAQIAAGTSAGSGLGAPGPWSQTGSGTASAPGFGATGAGSASGATVNAPGAPTTSGAAPASNVGAGAAPSGSGGGPIRVGFETIQGGNAFIAQGLGTPVNFGNGHEEVTGIVDDINKHGGVNGRKIQPFFGDWNPTSGDSGRESDCTAMTEDDKVSFIITVVNISASYVACAARHHVPIINASLGAGDDYLYKQYPLWFYSPSLLSLNTEEALVLTSGRASGRVKPSDKLGVVIDNTSNDPQYGRVLTTTVEPLLRSWRIPFETSSVATQADVNGAVLHFRADGVKTVLFIAPSGIIEILFMEAAENQGYRPDYILGDSAAPWFVGQAAPAAQVQHVTGAGSLPMSDVPASQYPTTPQEQHCFNVIRAAGEDNRNRQSSITATVYCQAAYEFVAIASHASGALTPASFYASYAGVRSFTPISTFAINFGDGRHTSASEYRTLGYTQRCQCISYTSSLLPVSV